MTRAARTRAVIVLLALVCLFFASRKPKRRRYRMTTAGRWAAHTAELPNKMCKFADGKTATEVTPRIAGKTGL